MLSPYNKVSCNDDFKHKSQKTHKLSKETVRIRA